MAYLKINNTDISGMTSGLKVGFETLVSDNSGRNASGNATIDIINRKVKIYAEIRYTLESEMQTLLTAIQDYVVNIQFRNPKDGKLTTISAYTSTPEPEYYTMAGGRVIYKPMSINFIEL